MTMTEVKHQIDAMRSEDRFFVAAYLQHLANERDGSRKAMLTARMKRMDDGHKVSFEQMLEVHEQLGAKGL
jgi:hypothetical protein